MPIPGTQTLLALNDAPEAVYMIDLSAVEDDAQGDIFYDLQTGWLPAARGAEADQGTESQTSVGPANMALHPDGRRLLVTNFNANSISVYDLSLGPHGQLVYEVPLVGENPYALEFSPDGLYAIFANYTGETDEDSRSHASLGVLDMDEGSPTYLTVRTWIQNK